jgi:phosphoribosylformylglycinamidine synthase
MRLRLFIFRGRKLSGRKAFFFEKKKQKTFVRSGPRWTTTFRRAALGDKSFLLLFFKKEGLPSESSAMRAAILIFPGTNRERDAAIALHGATGHAPLMVWHGETELPDVDLLLLPGGFSHGDYLRCGAMAAQSPIMPALHAFVARGGHVLGICNGFQILTEAGLLPGALLRNASLRFISRDCHLRVERAGTAFTRHYQQGEVFRAPMAHGDGNYFASAETIAELEGEGRVAFRYVNAAGEVEAGANPNGSINAIAGIYSANFRVLGLMPHPEDLVDPLMGGVDGKPLFSGLVEALAA